MSGLSCHTTGDSRSNTILVGARDETRGTVFEVRANMSSADETLPELVDEPVPDDAQDLE